MLSANKFKYALHTYIITKVLSTARRFIIIDFIQFINIFYFLINVSKPYRQQREL